MNRTLARTCVLASALIGGTAALAMETQQESSITIAGDVDTIEFTLADTRYPVVEDSAGDRRRAAFFTALEGELEPGFNGGPPRLHPGRFRMQLSDHDRGAGVRLILRTPPSVDITADGCVDGKDLALVIANWGCHDCALGADVVPDCDVNIHDLVRVLDSWTVSESSGS